MAQRENIYAERNKRIQEVCRGVSDLYESPRMGREMWFDLRHHFAICMHPKARIVGKVSLIFNIPKQLFSLNRLGPQHGKGTYYSFQT